MAHSVITTATDAVGRALAALRSTASSLHPAGDLYAGRLTRPGSDDPIGVPWIDNAGADEVTVRVSRLIGLPGPLPDLSGMAIRLRKGQMRYGDLLLTSTGWDPLTRHLVMPAWNARWPLTTLLPSRSPVGPLVIGARPVGERGYELSWARVGHGWQRLGELALEMPLPDEDAVTFDPVANPLPGLQQYGWVERLRRASPGPPA